MCLLNDGQFVLKSGCLFKCNMRNYSDDLDCQYAKMECFDFLMRQHWVHRDKYLDILNFLLSDTLPPSLSLNICACARMCINKASCYYILIGVHFIHYQMNCSSDKWEFYWSKATETGDVLTNSHQKLKENRTSWKTIKKLIAKVSYSSSKVVKSWSIWVFQEVSGPLFFWIWTVQIE